MKSKHMKKINKKQIGIDSLIIDIESKILWIHAHPNRLSKKEWDKLEVILLKLKQVLSK